MVIKSKSLNWVYEETTMWLYNNIKWTFIELLMPIPVSVVGGSHYPFSLTVIPLSTTSMNPSCPGLAKPIAVSDKCFTASRTTYPPLTFCILYSLLSTSSFYIYICCFYHIFIVIFRIWTASFFQMDPYYLRWNKFSEFKHDNSCSHIGEQTKLAFLHPQ